MRQRTLFGIAVLCAAVAFSSAPAHAFGLSGYGGKAGYVNPEDLNGTVGVSGHLEFEESNSRVHLLPSVGYWSTDGVHDLNTNMDVYYHFAPEGSLSPYAGAGLGLNFMGGDGGSDTDLGANLLGGLRVPASDKHFFLEGRYTITGVNQFALLGGVTFHK